MAKFDPSRVTGGTIELVRNPDGSYKSQVTGFNQISSLNLPDITTTAATTTSDATTAAAEKAQENLETQTSTAFKMPTVMQQDNQTDLSGDMTKEAAQTSKLLTETFKEPVEIKSPTDVFYDDFPTEQTTTQVNQSELGDPSPVENILNEAKVKEDDTTITLSKARIRGPRDLGTTQTTTRTPQGMDPLGVMSPRQERDQRFQDDAGMPEPALTDYPDLGPALGITTDTQPSATREAKERDFASGTLGISTREAKERDFASGTIEPIKRSSLQTFATSVKETFKDITIPSVVGTVLRAVVPPETSVQLHAKKYFNVRDDGRIAGNPTTDLYAGFNRTSAFGNLEKAGEKRIATREKTIERKGYGPGDKFYDDTQNMKNQQDDYKSSVSSSKSRDSAVAQEKSNRDFARGDSSDSGSSKIVCTAMYKTTGLEEWKKHIRVWQIFERKYLTPYHEKGYHILFKPFVKGMHKSNIIKALGAHVAKHRTQDLKHIMFNSKPSWIGRIYRKILEPICYLVGRLWR
jgi:hypothetical protein